jgi:hypothetical protein
MNDTQQAMSLPATSAWVIQNRETGLFFKSGGWRDPNPWRPFAQNPKRYASLAHVKSAIRAITRGAGAMTGKSWPSIPASQLVVIELRESPVQAISAETLMGDQT